MSQKITNRIMLITYPDCFGQGLKDLRMVLDTDFKGLFGGLHILPFFPSTADRGFSPTTYTEVDPRFGDWDDIMALGEQYYLMYDYMINHLSSESDAFKDFVEKKDASLYRDFFIRYKDFWSNGEPTKQDLERMYRRKQIPWITVQFNDGSQEKLWTTFSDYQVDINQNSRVAKQFHADTISFLASHGGTLIRLDAVAYAAKREGTSCFFAEPEIWELLQQCADVLKGSNSVVLPEIHENYFLQQKVEENGYYVYDFQLPMLVLNALYFGKSRYLKNWLRICPRKQFTTLDTHDGIGVVDARYLMPDEELLATRRRCFEMNPDVYAMYAHSGIKIDLDAFDTYQINCTYYSACGADDWQYYIARAIQFFAPGIPQVYYVGLLAGENDFELYNQTQQNRDVNRSYYSLLDVKENMKRPIVQKLMRLMAFRNTHPAFNGDFEVLPSGVSELDLCWRNGSEYAILYVDFSTFECSIVYTEQGVEKEL
ncbi:sucrose phosphorylase [Sphaerochaeta globosa]|uniref:Sucrose phosphorylase n=1 Tax=Sphaerochaeta globosa (strain ATCC BAA-1886 / DSM 22777 / Buddy) TaxID=158189 RepID=F0RRL2_SPHGB|nr:sucrose phosphorylase [Sphaerochaeta globosa]ADY14271.1 sucrose phosphorylase [Sphaerochaeta globosa str. Buddy]